MVFSPEKVKSFSLPRQYPEISCEPCGGDGRIAATEGYRVDLYESWMRGKFGPAGDLYSRIVLSLCIVIVIVVLRRLVLALVHRRTQDVGTRYRWRKATSYVGFAFTLFAVGGVWLKGVKALSTFLGLLTAGIAIALREPIVNLAGWGFIMWRRPFEVGDRIQIGEHSGDVIDTRIFQFSLLEIGNWVDSDQSTGRIINIPNGKVFSETLANYTMGFNFIWDEVPVLVTFESDWEKAKEILTGIADRHGASFSRNAERQIKQAASMYLIFFNKLTPIVYTSVRDCGVLLTIRYLTEPKKRRGNVQAIWEDILREFKKCDDIDFAYPTQRFYANATEGKTGARAGGDRSAPPLDPSLNPSPGG
jgi:small-conductance mechanosensitive channel